MTTQSASDPAAQIDYDALSSFLGDPPPGTPPDVIEVLTLMAGNADAPLPPRVYFEAVEQSPVAISITDPEATILYVNQAFEGLTGYTCAQVLGKNESVLSSRATPESIYRQLWRTIQGKRVWSGILVNRARDGGEYVAALTITPVLDRDGEIAYFLGMHRDVSHEHALETQLRRQTRRLEAVLNALPVLVVLLDESGRVFLDNHHYRKLRAELNGAEPLELLRGALTEQAGFDPLEAIRAGRSFKDVEVSIEVTGGRHPRWFSCTGTPATEDDSSAGNYFGRRNSGSKHLLLLVNETTAQRREVQRAYLENLRARLAEQQLAQGMREALAGAIYQIQGPLNVVSAALGMLRRGTPEPTTLASMLAQVHAAGGQALATLRAALPEAEKETGTLVNINELLRKVLELETDRLLSAGIVVDWHPAPVLPNLTGQKNQLRSMFKHLIGNAILALNTTRRTHRELHLSTRAVERSVEVVIQDNGPGIAPEDRLKVFEPFFIGWRDRRGRAGMGLALTQEIVNEHGGSVAVDPDYHDGCRIRVTLRGVATDA